VVLLRASGVASIAILALFSGTLAARAFEVSDHGEAVVATANACVAMLDLVFGLTNLAAPFLAIVAILGLAVAFWSVRRGRPVDAVLIAGFVLAMIGVLTARSIGAFFIAWEAMSLISAFLVAAHHERRFVRRTTFLYLVITQGGALCILAALALLATHAGSPFFTEIARHADTQPSAQRNLVFVLALIGFGSKAGLIPLHFWLPRAHPVAPAAASALLSGAMLKVALYGLLAVTLELAAPAPAVWGVVLILVGAISALGGVLYAVVERDFKRLLAYSSVENIGIIVLALGVSVLGRARGNDVIANLALLAALFHAFNHALFKSLLFLGAGVVNDLEKTVDIERLGGLWHVLRWTAPLVLIGCAAIAGVPLFNGFLSEWLVFESLIALLAAGDTPTKLLMAGTLAALALTSGLAAACFLKLFGTAFLGSSRRPAVPHARERWAFDTAALAMLAGLCIVFGAAPFLGIRPLAHVVAGISQSTGDFGDVAAALAALPLTLMLLPLAGTALSLVAARRLGVRYAPTWTCGSAVTPAAQYTATAFSKPLRTIFAFLLMPDRSRAVETGTSSWFPSRIVYRTKSRYLIDEFARSVGALTLVLARRSRVVQSGSLRLYVAYAIVALVVTVAVAR
jgi:hydrogenase-4 component B